MSLADKLKQIAENEQAVYRAGFAAGQAAGGIDERFKALTEGTMEELNDDTIVKTRSYAFAFSSSLKTATLSNLTSGGTSFFSSCTALETVTLPALKAVPYTGFSGCTALKTVSVPNADGSYGSFVNCTSLEFIDLPKYSYMHAMVFNGCTALKTLVLRATKVITLNSTNAFMNTPFRNGEGGIIYVPQALVESYKTATNWNALESTTFLPIEGSEYE